MTVVEKLSEKMISELFLMYEKVWFTQNRSLSEIRLMLDNSYLTLGFSDKGELIGFYRVISDGVFKAFLFDVIVKEQYQKRGVGSLIINTVLNHEKLKSVKHIELYCPQEISGFYKRLGFKTRTSILMRK